MKSRGFPGGKRFPPGVPPGNLSKGSQLRISLIGRLKGRYVESSSGRRRGFMSAHLAPIRWSQLDVSLVVSGMTWRSSPHKKHPALAATMKFGGFGTDSGPN